METDRLLNYIKTSFLSDLLSDDNVTDISYNGKDIYYLHNLKGRMKSDQVVSEQNVRDFIRQISNLSEKQFSYQSPNLDVSVGNLRINALHHSLARVGNEPKVNFSIRIGSTKLRIDDRSDFLSKELVVLFETLIINGVSIIIGGSTGCGKTEFQKYLLTKMPENTRIIVIDNVSELTIINNCYNADLSSWLVDEKNDESSAQKLIKIALRSNPDWLLVAEARGEEMIDVLNSAMTGHPIITTIHGFDGISLPSRIGRMIMMNDKKISYDSIMKDVYYHFPIYIFLQRTIDKQGLVKRYVKEVIEFSEDGNPNLIYTKEKGVCNKLSKNLLSKLQYKTNLFSKYFEKVAK